MAAIPASEIVEATYDLIAQSIDEVGVAQESLFLSKLCLALANQVADIEKIEASVRLARKHLGGRTGSPE